MNPCKCHYCWEGKKGKFCLSLLFVIAGFESAVCRNSLISKGTNSRLKPGKLLSLRNIQN